MNHPRVLDYEKLKTVLTTALVLAQPEYELKFILSIDACLDGLGAALHQEFLINDKIVENPYFISLDKLNLPRKGMEQAKLNV